MKTFMLLCLKTLGLTIPVLCFCWAFPDQITAFFESLPLYLAFATVACVLGGILVFLLWLFTYALCPSLSPDISTAQAPSPSTSTATAAASLLTSDQPTITVTISAPQSIPIHITRDTPPKAQPPSCNCPDTSGHLLAGLLVGLCIGSHLGNDP